jgi:hypothetical protein
MSYELQDKDGPVGRKRSALGCFDKGKSPRVLISFEPFQFLLIQAESRRRKISFASVVRELIDDSLCKPNGNEKKS